MKTLEDSLKFSTQTKHKKELNTKRKKNDASFAM